MNVPTGFGNMCFVTTCVKIVKNVGAGTGSALMKISIEWRVETEVQLVVLCTILQDWEKSIGIFLLFHSTMVSS